MAAIVRESWVEANINRGTGGGVSVGALRDYSCMKKGMKQTCELSFGQVH